MLPTPLHRIHDRDGTGGLSLEEFGKLHEFLTNVQHSFEYFDQDRSNSLSYDEIYLALTHAGGYDHLVHPPARLFCGASSSKCSCSRAGAPISSCHPARSSHPPQTRILTDSFSHIHRKRACGHAGYNLERPALEVVFKRFDPSRSGALTLPEFLALTLFLRSATATFNAFDQQRTGIIHLNFNQFLYSAANTI